MQGMLSGIERTIPKKLWMNDYIFILVQTIEELETIIDAAIAKGFCSLDLESTGLDSRVFNGKCNTEIVGYSLAFEPKICYYIPMRHKIETDRGRNLDPKKVSALIQKLILFCSIVGHNWLKFDIEMMFAADGIDLPKIGTGKPYPYHDTYVLARLAGMNPAGLKHLSKKLLDKEMIEITEVVVGSKKYIDFSSISPFEGCLYAASDAICTFELWFHPEIQKPIKEQSFIYTIERKLLPTVRRMERNKIKLDVEHCKKLDYELITKIEEIELELYRMVSEKTEGKITTFKIDSPADVSHILFDIYDMNPKPEQGKNGNYKTDDETLEKLAVEYPLAKKMQEYRTSTKFHRTYIKNMLINVDKDGYLKFNFSPLRTDSGRFASPGKSDAGESTDGCSGVNIQCLSGDTLVLIKDIGFTQIKNVSGQEVVIWDGESFVKARCISSGKKRKVTILFHNNQEVICSPDHRFLTKTEDGKHLKWKIPSEFNKRESILLSNEVSDFNSFSGFEDSFLKKAHNSKFLSLNSITSHYDLGIILGRFASDGTITKNHRISWDVANHELNILTRLEGIIGKIGYYWVKEYVKKGLTKKGKAFQRMHRINLDSAYLANFITDLNLKVKIPEQVLSSKEILRGFLCGFFDGDGGISGNIVTLTLGKGIHKFLYAKEIQKALTIFGIQSRVKKYPESTRLRICRGSQCDFSKKIGFINEIKQKKLELLKPTTKISRHLRNVQNVKSVTESKEYIEMFDIVGCPNERFAADGFIVHNSTPARYDESKPNVRKCISCDDDEVIVAMDWSGVEIRVATNMSLEPIWLDRFLNGDGDLHTSTASIIHDISELEVTKEQRQVGKCVDPSSLLFINGRYERIGSLSDKREVDTFYNLDKDLNVKISDKDTAKIKQFYSNGPGDKLLVMFRRGLLACSKNHRIELEDGNLVRADEIKEGMVLKEVTLGLVSDVVDKEISINPFLCGDSGNKTFFARSTEDLTYVLGMFLGDGGCSKNSCNIHTGGDGKYLEWQKNVKDSLERVGLSPNINKNMKNKNGGMCGKVYFGSRHTISILQQLEVIGQDFKKSLKVPSFILNGDLRSKLSFLGGMIDTDGTVGKKGNVDMTTKSWVFAQDLCVLLASCNFHYSVEPTFNKKYERYYYRIRIAKAHNSVLRNYLRCPWKIERMTDSSFAYSKFPENKVTRIIPLGVGDLVDVGIDHPEHIYLVNNIRTHNTFNFQSIYGGGPGALASTLNLDIEDAKEKQMRFFGRLVKLNQWIKSLQALGKKQGYCLTQFGRKRMLPEFESEIPRVQSNAKRKAVNTPVQGSAADLMKIAMILIDNYIEDNNLRDKVQLLLTMHDELVFRIKKDHVDVIPELERVMRLEETLHKIKWKVPLAVDVEIGPSWDIEYDYKTMKEYLKEKLCIDNVYHIYSDGQNYKEHLKAYKSYKKEKKAESAKEQEDKSKLDKSEVTKDDFKKVALELVSRAEIPVVDAVEEKPIQHNDNLIQLKSEPSEKDIIEEKVNSIESSNASASDIDKYFHIMQNANLSDLPEEAYHKLKRSFYEKEVERILSGIASEDDVGIELPIVVHEPIDSSKKNLLGYIIDSCPGCGKVKFLTEKKEELHKDWVSVDVLKASVMCKVFNL